jgi:two-component system sensor histidine kinase/response regulator
MGGRILVESQPGKGSTFYFTLHFPRHQANLKPYRAAVPTPQMEARTRVEALRNIRGARLLLVEDNVINQELTVEILKETGLMIDISDHGRTALSRVDKTDYDLILMDVQMPEMSGLEATALMRKMERLKDIPIVAMTAHNTLRDKQECLNAGMNDYMTKPLDIDMLTSILIKWIKPRTQTGESLPPGEQEHSAATASDDVQPDFLPGLDVADGLMRLQGNKRLYIKLLNSFIRNYEQAPDDISAAVQKGDYSGAAAVAHAIKGAAANLSMTGVAASAADLQDKTRNDHRRDFPFALQKFSAELIEAGASIHRLTEIMSDAKTTKPVMESLDPEELASGLARLSAFLEKSDLRAEESFVWLKKQMDGRGFHSEIEMMEEKLTRLEFSQALGILSDLGAKLKISTGGNT